MLGIQEKYREDKCGSGGIFGVKMGGNRAYRAARFIEYDEISLLIRDL